MCNILIGEPVLIDFCADKYRWFCFKSSLLYLQKERSKVKGLIKSINIHEQI